MNTSEFLNELKKLVFIKTKIIDGIEKRIGFDFEEKAYELIETFLKNKSSFQKMEESIEEKQKEAIEKNTVIVTAQQTPIAISETTPSEQKEADESDLEEDIRKVLESATSKNSQIVDNGESVTVENADKVTINKEKVEFTTSDNPIIKPKKISVEVPGDLAEIKALPEPNASFPPANKETVGNCCKYFKEHGIKEYKTAEWYDLKFQAYLIPKSMYEGVENLADLHRRWLGAIDSNGKFILWQFAWIKYNHENNKPLYENTFVVDKSRLTKYYNDDVINHKPKDEDYLKERSEGKKPEVKKEETPEKEQSSTPKTRKKNNVLDDLKPPKPTLSSNPDSKLQVNFN